MKALTLWQPWASLVALGHKAIETRGWSTRYRGPLLIHAAALGSHGGDFLRDFWFVNGALEESGRQRLPDDLPFGKVVAVCRLADCVRVESEAHRRTFPPLERVLGDLSVGRRAWHLADVRSLDRPIPCKGAQGLWAPSPELVARLDNDGDDPGQLSLFGAEGGAG